MRRSLPTRGEAAVLRFAVFAFFGVIAATILERACEDAGARIRPPQAQRAAPCSSSAARPDLIATMLAALDPHELASHARSLKDAAQHAAKAADALHMAARMIQRTGG
jgi:alpha/beta superfamily hydrolase